MGKRTNSVATVSLEQAESPLIAALDIGTSSVRTALFDGLGRAVEGIEARGRFPNRPVGNFDQRHGELPLYKITYPLGGERRCRSEKSFSERIGSWIQEKR